MSQSVFITGGSRGLGRALAVQYARDGARLGLLARNREDLEQAAALCRDAGAREVRTFVADVRDAAAVASAVASFAEDDRLDVCFANAGLIGSGEAEVIDRDVFEVNFFGCVNTVEAASAVMLRQRSGTIVVLSSFSAYRGVPSVPAYAASKAAVHNYAESLRNTLAPRGVTLKTAVFGYLNTELSANSKKPGFLVTTVEDAATRLRKLAAGRRSTLLYPPLISWVYRVIRVLPPSLYDRIWQRKLRTRSAAGAPGSSSGSATAP
jgi:NAD(P)-dependent dehydrogenase (short-subunit alcohol dehydrogenase family)